jgi:hypothetical protein
LNLESVIMKLKSLLISLALSVATLSAAHTASDQKTASPSLAVNATQASDINKIVDGLVSAKVSGPEELFKIISGETQTTDRELPLQATVREAAAQKMRIMCYEEGKDTVVASTDPTLLGKPVSDFRTSTDEVVRDKAIAEIKKNGKERATFTYTDKPKADGPIVDGKGISEGRIVEAAGRNAFTNFHSEKKFLCTVGAKIAVVG